MEIETQYAVKTFFPATTFMQVYFEAVANAFDAGAEVVTIKIDTDGEISPTRLEVTIRDDGVGFGNDRFDNFRRLKEPQDPYHKGLGRLVYLQYFSSVTVTSAFGGQQRRFVFSDQFDGSSVVSPIPKGTTPETSLVFGGFRKDRLRGYDDLRPAAIKKALLDQFLPLFHEKKKNAQPFEISIELETDVEKVQHAFFSDSVTLTAADVPIFSEEELTDFELGAFTSVRLSYVVQSDEGQGDVLTAASVDGRAIPIRLVRDRPLPVGYSATVLFESEVFQGRSDSARQRLILPDDIPQETLLRVLRNRVAKLLNDAVPEIEQRNNQTRVYLEERFPHLVGLFEKHTVGVIDREDAIQSAQRRFFRKQREVLEADALDEDVFEKSLELSSRSLAEYILYRDIIIKRLEAVSADEKEEVAHNLIVPRYNRFEGDRLRESVYRNNAWILDDRFMTFRTALSEARMHEVVEAVTFESETTEDDGRPDIAFIFSADPDKVEAVDVVVVEVKRRAADDKEGPYAVTQLVKRAEKLIAHCPNIQRMWYFGVIEIDDDVARLLRNTNWKPLYSQGRMFYQEFLVEGVPTPMYLMSWDAVVKDAAARNHTFLELLKADLQGVAERTGGGGSIAAGAG